GRSPVGFISSERPAQVMADARHRWVIASGYHGQHRPTFPRRVRGHHEATTSRGMASLSQRGPQGDLMNTAWKLSSIGAAAALAAGCSTTTREVVREQPIVQQQPVVQAPTTVERTVILRPPPVPQEAMPAPPAPTGYTWLPGHWAFRNGAWQWESGSWQAGGAPPRARPAPQT